MINRAQLAVPLISNYWMIPNNSDHWSKGDLHFIHISIQIYQHSHQIFWWNEKIYAINFHLNFETETNDLKNQIFTILSGFVDNFGWRYEKIICIFDHWSKFGFPAWNSNLELTLFLSSKKNILNHALLPLSQCGNLSSCLNLFPMTFVWN